MSKEDRREQRGQRTHEELVEAQEAMPKRVVVSLAYYHPNGGLLFQTIVGSPDEVPPKYWPQVVRVSNAVRVNKKPGEPYSDTTMLEPGHLLAQKPQVFLRVDHVENAFDHLAHRAIGQAFESAAH